MTRRSGTRRAGSPVARGAASRHDGPGGARGQSAPLRRLPRRFLGPCMAAFLVALAAALGAPGCFLAPSAALAQEDPAKLFARDCATCHGADGRGTGQFPSLAAAGSAAIVEGKMRAGGGGMPRFVDLPGAARIPLIARFVANEVAASAARGARTAQGGRVFRLVCAGCHGATGRGGALVEGRNAPSFEDMPAGNALAAMIAGPGNMPVFSDSLSVRQQAAVARYVDVLIDPPSPGGLGLGYVGPVSEGWVALLALGALVLIGVWLAHGKGGDEPS